MTTLRIPVRVKPGSARSRVGGRYGDDELIVAVNAPPVDGAANEAVVKAVAKSLGLRPRQVTLASGHTSRSKVLEVDAPHHDMPEIAARLAELLDAS